MKTKTIQAQAHAHGVRVITKRRIHALEYGRRPARHDLPPEIVYGDCRHTQDSPCCHPSVAPAAMAKLNVVLPAGFKLKR